MRSLQFLTVCALPLALACSPPAEPPAPQVDLQAAKASLLDADQAWFKAYSASDSPEDVFAAQMVDDAVLLPPGGPRADGREAIRTVIGQLEALPGFAVTWEASLAEVGGAGDLGYTIGSYEMALPGPDGEPTPRVGKYLTVWKKQTDGSWMVAADMFNEDGAPPATE